jgi:hypothetical protein
MAASSSSDDCPAQLTLDSELPPLLCPCCDAAFSSATEDSVPMTFVCGHSLCQACASAVNNTVHPKCVICGQDTKGNAIVNRGLAELGDFASGSVPTNVSALPSVAEAVKKRKREPKARVAELIGGPSRKLKGVEELAAEVSGKLAQLRESSSVGDAAYSTLMGMRARMIQRKDASIEALYASVASFKRALDAKVADMVGELNSRCESRAKALETQADAYLIGSGQQKAAIACGERALTDRSREQLEIASSTLSLCEKAVTPWLGPTVGTCVGIKWLDSVSQSALDGVMTLQDSTKFPKCKISGPGLGDFVVGISADKNRLTVKFLDACNDLVAVPVAAEDVVVRFSQLPSIAKQSSLWGVVSIEAHGVGQFRVMFSVPVDSTDGARVTVSVCGTPLATAECCSFARASGVFRRAVFLPVGEKDGIAVNGDGTLMAVSYNVGRSSVKFIALPSGEEVASTVPVAGASFRKLCFVPPKYETVLVCCYISRVIREYRVDGSLVRQVGLVDVVGRANAGLEAVACDGQRVVVAGRNEFMVFDYETMSGSVTNVKGKSLWFGFGEYGLCCGIRFVNDDTVVCAHGGTHPYVSRWKLKDGNDLGLGATLKFLGDADLSEINAKIRLTDIEVLKTGECVVSCKSTNNMYVLDPDLEGSRCWGEAGTGDGKIDGPKALSVQGSMLYILDSSNRVQLFY